MKSGVRNILYLLSLTGALVSIAGNLSGGIFTLGNFAYTLVFLGTLEMLIGDDKSNHSSGKNDRIPNTILLLHVPFQTLSVLSLIYGIGAGIISGIWIPVAAISTAVNSGSSAVVVAHEMIHRRETWWKNLGKYLLFTAGNTYFYIEHLQIHHHLVGTNEDPASAHKGESLYRFFFRSLYGQITGAWKIESRRRQKQGKALIGRDHYVFTQLCLQALYIFLVFSFVHPLAGLALLLHMLVASFLLEYVNYIEHYGLTRTREQRVNAHHSWQSDRVISRFFLVDLSRHADHHYHAGKAYHNLQSIPESPELPGGYATLFFPAMVPFWWYRLVDKRIPQ